MLKVGRMLLSDNHMSAARMEVNHLSLPASMIRTAKETPSANPALPKVAQNASPN